MALKPGYSVEAELNNVNPKVNKMNVTSVVAKCRLPAKFIG